MRRVLFIATFLSLSSGCVTIDYTKYPYGRTSKEREESLRRDFQEVRETLERNVGKETLKDWNENYHTGDIIEIQFFDENGRKTGSAIAK